MRLFIILLTILTATLHLNNSAIAQNFNDSNEITKVDSEEIKVLEDHLNTPYRIDYVLTEDYLAVTDADNSPSLHIIKISNAGGYEYLKSMGREGKGPGEYVSPTDIVSGLNEDYFHVYDAGNRKIVKYNSDFEAINNEEISLQVQGMPISLQMENDKFLVAGVIVGSKLNLINRQGETVGSAGEHISLGKNVPPNALALAWHSYSTYSSQQNKVAVFARSADFAEVYDIESLEKVSEFYNDDFKVPDVRVEESGNAPRLVPNEDAKTTFIWASSTDDKIFALYSGKSTSHESDNYGDKVVVFDWELNVMDVLELDHQSFSILATEDENLYSIQHDPMPAVRYINLND